MMYEFSKFSLNFFQRLFLLDEITMSFYLKKVYQLFIREKMKNKEKDSRLISLSKRYLI